MTGVYDSALSPALIPDTLHAASVFGPHRATMGHVHRGHRTTIQRTSERCVRRRRIVHGASPPTHARAHIPLRYSQRPCVARCTMGLASGFAPRMLSPRVQYCMQRPWLGDRRRACLLGFCISLPYPPPPLFRRFARSGSFAAAGLKSWMPGRDLLPLALGASATPVRVNAPVRHGASCGGHVAFHRTSGLSTRWSRQRPAGLGDLEIFSEVRRGMRTRCSEEEEGSVAHGRAADG